MPKLPRLVTYLGLDIAGSDFDVRTGLACERLPGLADGYGAVQQISVPAAGSVRSGRREIDRAAPARRRGHPGV
jgi:hypothetical protein